MADLREIEIPEILKEIPQIVELYSITDKYIAKLEDDIQDVADDNYLDSLTEHGIKRREKILGIVPDAREDLESRRLRVMVEWTAVAARQPFSFRWLNEKIKSFTDSYELSRDTVNEILHVKTHFDQFGGYEVFAKWLDNVVPENMIINTSNTIDESASGTSTICGTVESCEVIYNSDNANYYLSSNQKVLLDGQSVLENNEFYNSDNSSCVINAKAESDQGGNAVNIVWEVSD